MGWPFASRGADKARRELDRANAKMKRSNPGVAQRVGKQSMVNRVISDKRAGSRATKYGGAQAPGTPSPQARIASSGSGVANAVQAARRTKTDNGISNRRWPRGKPTPLGTRRPKRKPGTVGGGIGPGIKVR